MNSVLNETTAGNIGLNTTEEILAELRAGRMVVIMDDEDRENEGDLIMAAAKVRPEDVNFMARFARGLICLTLTRDRCEQLRLPLMVSDTNARQSTNFTLSIEAREGVTTGISAADRARTIQVAVAADAKPTDLLQPGHIFPLMAQPGGVLTRAGHTEAGCDLAQLAGFMPAAVIVEILNDDGTMARRPQLEEFAKLHGLKIGTIADLIHYRMQNEKTISRVASCDIETEWGPFRLNAYEEPNGRSLHFALCKGTWSSDEAVMVRVHLEDTLADIVGLVRHDIHWSLRRALQAIAAAGRGAVVILRQPTTNRDLIRWVERHAADAATSAAVPSASADLRTYGVGAQIVADLGIHRMRVLGTRMRMHGLSGFGLEVVEYVEYQ